MWVSSFESTQRAGVKECGTCLEKMPATQQFADGSGLYVDVGCEFQVHLWDSQGEWAQTNTSHWRVRKKNCRIDEGGELKVSK
jgi:hypothetical protein